MQLHVIALLLEVGDFDPFFFLGVKKVFPFVNLDVLQNTVACIFYLIKLLGLQVVLGLIC